MKKQECFAGDGTKLTGHMILQYFLAKTGINHFKHTCIDVDTFYHIDDFGHIRASSFVPAGYILTPVSKIFSIEFVKYWEKTKLKHTFHDEHEIYDMFIQEIKTKIATKS